MLLGKSNRDSSSSGYLTFSTLSLPRLFLPLQQMAAVRAPCPWRCFPQFGSASGLKKRQDKKKKCEGRSQTRATAASAEKSCSRAAATCRDEAESRREIQMGTTRPAGAGADLWPPSGASRARTSLEFGRGEDGTGGQVLPVSQPRQRHKTQAGSTWSPAYKEPPVGSEWYNGGERLHRTCGSGGTWS